MLLRTLASSSDAKYAILGCIGQGQLAEQCSELLASAENTVVPASSVAPFAADVFIPGRDRPMPTSDLETYPL